MSWVPPDGLGTNPALTFMTNCDYSTRKPDAPLRPPWALYTLSPTHVNKSDLKFGPTAGEQCPASDSRLMSPPPLTYTYVTVTPTCIESVEAEAQQIQE